MRLVQMGPMAAMEGSEDDKSRMISSTTLHRRKHVGEDEKVEMCEKDDTGRLLVPRSHPEVLSLAKPIPRDPWTKNFQGFAMLSSLRDAQKELVDEFYRALASNAKLGGIISAPTGIGKTVMGISIASSLGMPTLIVVPRSVLVDQWKQRLMDHTDLKESDIGIVRQNLCQYQGKKVSIGLVHSLAQRRYLESLYSAFGLVIFDEVHTMGAETFSTVCYKFDSAVRLGLSATVRRKDGMANVFLWHIGPIVSATRVHTVRPKVVQIRYYNQATGHSGCYWNGRLILPRYLNRIASSPARNVFIAGLLKALYSKGHHILLLSDRLVMLTALKRLLESDENTRGKIGLFTNQEKNLTKQILLGTYGSADMGADIPRLTALVLATPRTDIVQAIGRVLRQGEPVVIDIIDSASSIMQGWGYARLKVYRQLNALSIQQKEYRSI